MKLKSLRGSFRVLPLLLAGATLPLLANNNDWYQHCEEGCAGGCDDSSGVPGSGQSCEVDTGTHSASMSFKVDNEDDAGGSEQDSDESCVVDLVATGNSGGSPENMPPYVPGGPTTSIVPPIAGTGGGYPPYPSGGGGTPPSGGTGGGYPVNNYDRSKIQVCGLPPAKAKTEPDANGKLQVCQFPVRNAVVKVSDLPSGGGVKVCTYPKKVLPPAGSNGIITPPTSLKPTSLAMLRKPATSSDPVPPTLDVIDVRKHPQTGADVTRAVRYCSPVGSPFWKRQYFLGDPAQNPTLLPYKEVAISRANDLVARTEIDREVTRELTSDGSTYVVTSDVLRTYAFYRPEKPVILSETRFSGTGDDLTTTWTYYTDAANQASFNKPATMRRSDGRWADYTYSGSLVTGVVVTKTITGWLDNAAPAPGATADEATNRVVVEIEAKHETGTFGREEKIQGVLVSKTWGERHKDSAGMLVEKTRVETGSATLLTIRMGYPKDASVTKARHGRLKSIQYPDGTVELHDYAMAGENRVETVDRGAGTPSGVTAGKRTVSTYAPGDILTKEVVSDIASGVVLSTREAIVFDSNDRVTRWAYDNNPDDYSETLYGCCGIEQRRGRDGIVTTYTHDALKRQKTEVSLGITTTTTYGAKTIGGVVCSAVSQVRTAGGLTEEQGTVVYDHAGNAIERIRPDLDGDSNPEIASTTYAINSRIISTTNPDGGTDVRFRFLDGQEKSRSGTAVIPVAWTYATHNQQGGGLVTTTYAGTTSSTRWTKTYVNRAGDAFKVTAPGTGGELAVQTNTFDNAGRLASTADADGVTRLHAYDSQGRRYRTALDLNQNGTIDAADRVTDTLEDVVTGTVIGDAVRTRMMIHDLSDNPVTLSTRLDSPNGLEARMETLGEGAIQTARAAWTDRTDGAWEDVNVAADGTKSVTTRASWRQTVRSRRDTSDNVIESVTTGYDALGRPVTSQDSRRTTVAVRTAYDGAGQITSTTEDLASGTDRIVGYAYDVVGRRIATTLPDSSVSHVSYWPTGREKAAWGSQSYPTVKLHTAQGELAELRTWRSGAPATPDENSTGFDATTWTYNDRGLLVAKTYADNQGPGYTYTPGGRLHTRTWARGTNSTYGYNTAGELTGIDYSDATPDVAITSDKLGRRTSVSNGKAQSVYTYDPTTLLPDTETASYDLDGTPGYEFSRVLDRSKDVIGRDTGWQLKHGGTVEHQTGYGYDTVTGRLSTVAGTGTEVFTYSYTAGSSLIAGVASPAHMVTNTWFADRDSVQLKENKVGTTVVSSFDYEVNAIGQRSGVAQAGTAFASSRNIAWSYDSLGQVTSADSSEPAADRSYEYDTIGNRKKSANNLTLPGSDNYTANLLNQYSSINHSPSTINPVYDADGNATAYPLPAASSSNATLTWDAENRLSSVTTSGTTVNYIYDSLSRLIARTSGGSTISFLYDGWNAVATYTGGGLLQTATWGLDLSGTLQGAGGVGGLLSITDHTSPPTVHYYPIYDGNGNVSEYLDATGAVAAHFEYDPFGRTVVDTDTTGTFRVRFSTKAIDVVTGLSYYGYRWYDPVAGRWTSRDPIEENGGINYYGICDNDTVRKIDILGMYEGMGEASEILAREGKEKRKKLSGCCDGETIRSGKNKLNDRFDKWKNKQLTNGRPQGEGRPEEVGGDGSNSCYCVNSEALEALRHRDISDMTQKEWDGMSSGQQQEIRQDNKWPNCWHCHLENRMRRSGGPWYRPEYRDHWVVICQAWDKQGDIAEEVSYDFWKKEAVTGADPNTTFRREYRRLGEPSIYPIDYWTPCK